MHSRHFPDLIGERDMPPCSCRKFGNRYQRNSIESGPTIAEDRNSLEVLVPAYDQPIRDPSITVVSNAIATVTPSKLHPKKWCTEDCESIVPGLVIREAIGLVP